MADLHYTRETMLPQVAPPITERGLVKWLRQNLFSSVFNTVLTLVAIYVVYQLVAAVMPWLLNGVWNAKSLNECRSIIAANGGEASGGACWAMIRDRWDQWIFGYYTPDYPLMAKVAFSDEYAQAGGYAGVFAPDAPKEVRLAFIGNIQNNVSDFVLAFVGFWRPVLAFVLMFVALAPVLFNFVPKQLLWFTLMYPVICFFLLWGGSVWVPIVAVLGLALVCVASVFAGRRWGAIAGTIAAVLLFALIFLDPLSSVFNIVGGFVGWWSGESVFYNPVLSGGDAPLMWRSLFPLLPHVSSAMSDILPWELLAIPSDKFGGFLLAITIGVTAIAFSLPLGILLALGRQSDMLIVKTLSVGFIEFIRGVPLITLLFTASLLLQYFLPPGTTFDIILRVIILVTLFAAAYLAEVIRGGLAALPRGQYEAADALGLDYWQAQRLIILPQALKISIPSIVSTFIGLFKDTTLVSFVGLFDPLRGVTNAVRSDINWKGIYWEPYIFVGAIFFVICFSMSRYSMYLENKLKTDHR